jgi:hypothetical protein
VSSEHRVLIDWLSFTLDVPEIGDRQAWVIHKYIDDQMSIVLGELWTTINGGIDGWELSSGRPPYGASYRTDKGISIYYNARLPHCLIEVSGRGCEYLQSLGILKRLIQWVHLKVTRIDIAVDMHCATSPSDFVKESQSARFKSRQSVTSETGDTEYIGSRSSERYCRVYRYAPPHPRHAFLRAEMVFRKQNAKLFVEKAIQCGFDLTALALGAGQVYGFEHASWNLSGNEIPLSSWTPEREQGKTVRWLISQVAPAFQKLVSEGVIEDPQAFFDRWFLGLE